MRVLIFLTAPLLLGIICQARTITVDDDKPADFSSIQEAIDYSSDGDLIEVQPGIYYENIYFYGKAITLKSTEPNDPNIVAQTMIDGDGIDSVITFAWGEGPNSIIDGFTIANGQGEYGGGVLCWGNVSPCIRNCSITANRANEGGGIAGGAGSTPSIENCIISENSAVNGGGISNCHGKIFECLITSNKASNTAGGLNNCGGTINNCIISGNTAGQNGGGIGCSAYNVSPKISLCTVVGNRAQLGGGIYFGQSSSSDIQLKNSIICKNTSFGIYWKFTPAKVLSYNNVYGKTGDNYGGWAVPGEGDISVDPCFAEDGYWDDSSGTQDDPNDDIWIDGDYHLKSQVGRFNPVTQKWVIDALNSDCVDAGDPYESAGQEPYPNGDRLNLGAYGGTAEASKSPLGQTTICVEQIAGDLSGDCMVDIEDLRLFSLHWLEARNLGVGPPELRWASQYRYGGGDDVSKAVAMVVDESGSSYVTGYGYYDMGLNADWFTVKYDPNGNQLWVARYDGPYNKGDYNGEDRASAIALDSSGYIYVTGYSAGSDDRDYDYTTVKYDPNGKQLWVTRYNGPEGESDKAVAIAIDSSDNIYVTGSSVARDTDPYLGSWLHPDYVTVKYDPNGNQLWVSRYNDRLSNNNEPKTIVIDNVDNVYVIGNTLSGIEIADYYSIVKYDSQGNQLWVAEAECSEQYATAGAVDHSGNLYVLIEGWDVLHPDMGRNYHVVKYDYNGKRLWQATYNGQGNGDDRPTAIVVDSSGNACVTGSSYSPNGYTDYATIKYEPNGEQFWVARYDGPAHYGDEAHTIATDKFNNIYVTGNASGAYHEFSGPDYTTVIYNPDGDQLGVASYGPGIDLGGLEIPTASIVDRMGNVYVTGYAQAELGCKYLTIMYSATLTCTAEISGDMNNDCEVDLIDLAIMAEHWLQCNLDPPEACWD